MHTCTYSLMTAFTSVKKTVNSSKDAPVILKISCMSTMAETTSGHRNIGATRPRFKEALMRGVNRKNVILYNNYRRSKVCIFVVPISSLEG